MKPFADTTESELDELYAVHLKAPYLLTQKLLPLLADGGRVLNVSTGLARFAMPGYSAYAAMKGAIEVLTRYQAIAAEGVAHAVAIDVEERGLLEVVVVAGGLGGHGDRVLSVELGQKRKDEAPAHEVPNAGPGARGDVARSARVRSDPPMPDFFLLAAARQADAATWTMWGHMLGSIHWDEVALLSRILVGVEYDYDDVEWEEPRGDTQVGRVPDAFATGLAGIADERLSLLAGEWHALLCAEAGWQPQRAHSLVDDLEGLRTEALRALKSGGALWLRIEP